MSFLNWLLLGGAAAGGIPVLVHMLNRRRHRVVRWGAMHLLHSVVLQNRRRIRIEQILLLIVRCAIPVLLALCMARPVLTGWQVLAGESPGTLVILLDDSYSMQVSEGGRSRFDAARDTARRLLDEAPRGSEAAVVLTGGEPRTLGGGLSFDLQSLADRLEGARPVFGRVDTAGALERAAALLGEAAHANRSVVMISDFQRGNWEGLPQPRRQQLAQLVRGGDGAVGAALTLFDVGGRHTEPENVVVESLELSREIVGVNQRLTLRAHLRNRGQQRRDDLRVLLRVDGEQREADTVSLAPGEVGQVVFPLRFEDAGSHLVEVETDGEDLPADNLRRVAVRVLDRLPVLLVDGDPSQRRLGSETGFLRIALQPFAAAQDAGLADLIAPTVINADEFQPEDLEGMRAAVLADVRRLDDETVDALRRFVERGGGLVVFPGDRTDPDQLNATLGSGADGPSLLPMDLAGFAGSGSNSNGSAGNVTASILDRPYENPVFAPFSGSGGGLGGARIERWYRLRAQDAGAEPRVLAELDTGDPFLVERSLGRGAVILATTACDARWSNLPTRPFYLPLMQRLITYLATRGRPAANVEPGGALVAHLSEDHAGQGVEVRGPDGYRRTLQPETQGDRAVAELEGVRRPGLYTMHPADGEMRHFVVRASREESRLQRMPAGQLGALGETMDASVVDNVAAYAQLGGERRHGRELWQALLVAVLLLMLGELMLQQWFARGRA